MKKKRIYLDYASTTPVDPRVFDYMKKYFFQKFGNPMSLHSFGREADEAIETARKQAADFFGCEKDEIIFTSGATESNNLAVKGTAIADSLRTKGSPRPHIITTSIEHSCILSACQALADRGMAEITYLPVGSDGLVRAIDIEKSLKPNTLLVSIMYVNNEIGTIQPIREVGKIIEKANKNRDRKIIFHTDATQAISYLDCRIENLGVDLLSMSAHKIYGPKGIGCLFIKKGTPIKRIQDGGGQEFNFRSGTHNVPAIAGLGKALELVETERKKVYKMVEKLRDYMISRIMKEVSGVKLNGSKIKRSPNNANFAFKDVEGEGLLLGLDLEGVAVSTGSACSSGDLRPSHVLAAIGLSDEESHGSMRITLGKYTTKQEIEYFINALKNTVSRLRKIAGK
ncbi:MAG: cysteine desulfurase family protein [Parcubacteria group bacterium]|jgi:cysteine desulfurase